ncbi:helix-turn-helix transcriptional regulator [Pseudomonas aeruginosa]
MRIISLKEVMDLTSLARSTIYKYIALGTFPLPLSVGERCVRWLESEVHEWILERIAERDEKLQAVGKHYGDRATRWPGISWPSGSSAVCLG